MATGVGGQKCDWQHSMAHPWKSLCRRKNLPDISYTDRVLSQISLPWQRVSIGKNAVYSIRWPIPEPLPHRPRRKNLADIFYTSRIIANFVPNFVAMATGVGQGKMQLAAFGGPSPNPPSYRHRCKNLAKISYASWVIASFVPNFVAMATGVGRGKCNWQHSMAHPRKLPYRRKNLAKISYARRVMAHFVPNFVAMATGVGRKKCDWQHSMAHPRKFPYRRKNLPKISYASRVIANFVPNFVAMATGVDRGKMQLAAFDGPSPKTPL